MTVKHPILTIAILLLLNKNCFVLYAAHYVNTILGLISSFTVPSLIITLPKYFYLLTQYLSSSRYVFILLVLSENLHFLEIFINAVLLIQSVSILHKCFEFSLLDAQDLYHFLLAAKCHTHTIYYYKSILRLNYYQTYSKNIPQSVKVFTSSANHI